METPQRSYAWEGERMPHHQSSADGDACTSGRTNAEEPGSTNSHLRSVAQLPRSSRNGAESPPLHPAAELLMQDGQASLRGTDLRARPPSSLERGVGAVSAGRKARRGSIAEFLGIRSALGSQDSSAAPSRDVTLHGMGATPPLTRRSRRASVMQTLGFGSTTPELEPAESGPSAQLETGLETRSKSLGAAPQGRRRRASMLDLFRQPQNTDASLENADDPSRQLTRSKSSAKSRRASVIDFFRSSNTGIASTEETVGSAPMRRQSRVLRGDGGVGSRSQRRRSVIDILGQSSKKVFAKLMNQDLEDEMQEEVEADEGRLWFTSLSDFKPLTFKYLTGRYSSAFFACSVKTGQHYILKQFEKGKMSLADERGVRRALAFAHMLEHEHIMQCCGTWEDEQALYIVEEYATKGDLLQDSMSHPEKYTEAFMATKVVKPLLEVLVYLHNMNVVHRAIFPEYVMFGREDTLKLGHFTSAIDQRLDPPTERIPFLDYMAPEMLSVRADDPTPCLVAGMPQAAAVPPWAGTGCRTKLPASQTRVVRMQGPSNDGTPGSQQQQLLQPPPPPSLRAGASMHPQSPVSSRDPSPYDHRSPQLAAPAAIRRAGSTSEDLGGLAGSPHDPEPEPPDKSPRSRGGIRSPLDLFRSMRRLSPQQLADEEAPTSTSQGSPSAYSGVSGTGRRGCRGSDAAEAPWLLRADGSVRPGGGGGAGVYSPTQVPPRRRKSALDEMSAPWLRPVEAVPSSEADISGRETLDADDARDRADSSELLRPDAGVAVEAPTGWGAVPAVGGGSGSSGMDRADSGGSPAGAAAANPPGNLLLPSWSSLRVLDSLQPETSTIAVVPLEAGTVGQLSDPQVERTSGSGSRPPSEKGSGGAAGALSYGGGAAAAAAATEPGPGPPPRPMSSRRPGSALPPPASSSTRRANSLVRSDTSSLSERNPPQPDRDECLPGYATESPPPPTLARQASSCLRPQTARRQGSESLSSSPPPPPSAMPSPGPVMESLLLNPPPTTPSSPYDVGNDVSEVKRVRAAVSFTTNTTTVTGEESAAGTEDRPSSRAPRSRIVSRETSATAGSGQVINGLRSMARNITIRLGQVLGARASEASSGPQGDVLSMEMEQGLGQGPPGEPTPRPSQAGGGGGGGSGAAEATALFMPNNPWEWQDHYDEKVDLWQVGCLVHEILCLSLPFETDDKLLACALILWADIVSFPDHLSPECHDFMRACLTKNPAERPSAADLLLHPWVARHAAGEVLKSVRQHKEEENLADPTNGQQLTTLQRAAAVVGLGWLAGVSGASGGGGAAAAGAARSGAGGWFGSLGWLTRPWTSKVSPARGRGLADPDGEGKFEMAMAMVQEQHAAEVRRRSLEAGGRPSLEATRRSLESIRRRSLDVESGDRRHSLESLRQYHQHQHQGGAGGSVLGSPHPSPSSRWGVMM